MSLIGATTSLGQRRRSRWQWGKVVGAFVLAGVVTSAMVGYLVGTAGSLIRGGLAPAVLDGLAIAAVIALSAREVGAVKFKVPTARRQTEGAWFQRWGLMRAAVLWGADIGLTYSTWIRSGGLWGLTAWMVTTGTPSQGALCLVSYWLGRSSPTVLGPFLMPVGSAGGLHRFLAGLRVDSHEIRRAQVVGVLLLLVSVVSASVAVE